MAASNREERLQMRQRGAGTRKIQEVNFGFSFGSPLTRGQAASIADNSESVSNSIDAVVEKTVPTATTSVTDHTTKDTPTRTLRVNNATTESPRRTPRNSANRVSLSNNPVDEQEGGRSSKRRRISTNNDGTPTSISKSTPTSNQSPSVIRATRSQKQQPENSAATGEESQGLTTTGSANNNESHLHNGQNADISQEPVRTTRSEKSKAIESSRSDNSKAQETRNKTRKHTRVDGPDPPRKDNDSQEDERVQPRTRNRRGLGGRPSLENDAEIEPEPEREDAARPRRKRGQQHEDADKSDHVREAENGDNRVTKQAPRGRRKSSRQSTNGLEAEERENTAEENTPARTGKKRKGKHKENDNEGDNADETQEQAQVTQTSKRRGKARDQEQQPREGADSGGTRRRGRPSLSKEQEPEEAEPESTERRPTEPAQPPKRRRGRSSTVTTRGETSNAQPASQSGQNSTRESEKRREGTVAITVHRLANTQVLDSTRSDSASDNEQDSSDELDTVGKKFPSRASVNAADVLSQICKEILDKHVTALENNLDSDAANQNKRSEYARQRKAIEAYGAQLEGRLFELSELLDSNFTLGVQFKKAKREAAERRNRLLEIRQQRHEVTLRMDAVRRKHGDEEDAKMSRNAMNNTLHNLELTLDRNRVRPDDNDEMGRGEHGSVAGLEFSLRSISDSVSSAAEGSHGGLLNQMKAFNAQLEMTAKKLERQ